MKEIKHEHQTEILYSDFDYYQSHNYILYRKEWNERFEKKDYGKFPVNLDVSVTNHCNLKCTMCARTHARKDMALWNSGKFFDPILSYIDFDLYKKAIDEGADNGLFSVHLTGHDGEPSMHKQLPEMISYARKRRIVDVYTHSNATRLHKGNLIERLLDAQPHRIVFSVDSPIKETYESIRVGAKYDQVIENIRNFVKRKKEKGYVFPIVKVQMVVMNKNQSEQKLFVDDIGVDVIGYTEYLNYQDLNTQGDLEVSNTNKGEYKENYVCDYPYKRLRLDQSGKVFACLVGMEHELGHISEKSISEMWDSSYMNNLRTSHILKGASKTHGCTNCGRQWEKA
jgi:MoaA/NifB/PqqE/SkfB family radical SAM enzyme